MLLAIDISNTNIKLGLYNSATMSHNWVVSTVRQRTTDEYAMVLNDLIRHVGYRLTDIDDIILSSVVPPLTPVFQEFFKSLRCVTVTKKRSCWIIRWTSE